MREINKLSILCFIFIFIFNLVAVTVEKTEGMEKKQKLARQYKKWLEEDVIYIISQNEKEVFKSLRTDEERDNFIKTFWRRRDPTPLTPFNEFKEEHYRRIEYAKKNFFEGRVGWRTDRGRVYIMFGPPDFRETNPGGARGFIFGPSAPTAEFPSEIWTYREIPGLRARLSRIDFTFIDYYNSGSYQLAQNPALANALRNVSLAARYAGYDDAPLEDSPPSRTKVAQSATNLMRASPLEQLSLMAELTKSRGEVLEELERSARIRKLKGIVETKESLAQITFVASESFLLGERDLTYIPISIEVAAKDLGFEKVKDRYKGLVNFYIEVKDNKSTVYQASDRLEMNLKEETYRRRFTDYYQYTHSLSLKPGEYFIHLVVWDEYNANVGYIDREMNVPQFTNKELSLSEVMLAREIRVIEPEDKEEKIVLESKKMSALKDLEGTGLKIPEKIEIKQEKASPFVFGNLVINPNTLSEYPKEGELVFFYQIYNPTFDSAQKMAKLLIEHQILRDKKLIAIINQPQEVQIPIEQKGPGLNSGATYRLSNLSSGKYTVLIRVKDIFSGKIIEKTADFRVR